MSEGKNATAIVVAPAPTAEDEDRKQAYKADKLGCLYRTIRGVYVVAVNTFFGDIDVVGLENIPSRGPVILVGNHKNQFVDAMMVSAIVRRKVSFLVAEKSMHRRIIGDFAKMMDAIAVIRPQDRARSSPGVIIGYDATRLRLLGSIDCSFTTNVKKGEMIVLHGVKGVAPIVIQEVLSDTSLLVKQPLKPEDERDGGQPATVVLPANTQGVSFKVIPKIDQQEVFKRVHDALCDGRCIGIFPEGGSSDRTDLLPLKAGVAIMALGAVARGAPVKIVPFGINYNEGHRLRSKVLVDIGKPLTVQDAILERYRMGAAREAQGELLKQIEAALRAVTFNAPDQHTLNILRTMRRLYQGEVKLPVRRFMELNRRFAVAFGNFRDDDRFLDLVARVHDYMGKVHHLGVTDRQVASLPPLGGVFAAVKSLVLLITDIILVIVVFILSIPGYIVFLPGILRVNYVTSQEVKKALASSNVKVRGNDVAASQKIIGSMIWFTLTAFVVTGIVIGLTVGLWPRESPYPAGSAADWFFINAIWLIPIGVFFFVPLIAFFNLVAVDYALRRIKWLPYRTLIVTSMCRRNSPGQQIRARRKELSLRVQEFFDKIIAPNFPEWAEDPIISHDMLLKKRRKSDVRRAAEIAEEIEEIAKESPLPDSPSLATSRKTIHELKSSMKRMEDNVSRFEPVGPETAGPTSPKFLRQNSYGISTTKDEPSGDQPKVKFDV